MNYQILQDQKELVINELSEYVKSAYPRRTKHFHKCGRDLTFVYEAYIDCLNHNSDRPLQFIIRNFYKRGECQLKSLHVELDVHVKLRNKMIQLLQENNASQESLEFFTYLSDEFIHQLEHGPRNLVMNYEIQKWIDRYTVREFDQENLPDILDVKELVNLIGYIPSQEAKFDHFWILYTPQHAEQKRWLMDNIYYSNIDENEYMWPVFNAPYVFQCVRVCKKETSDLDLRRNEGFHAGVLISAVLNMNYGVAQIGCTDGYHEGNRDENKKEFRNFVFENFGNKLSTFNLNLDDRGYVFQPGICVAFGVPLPMREGDFTWTDGVKHYVGQKPKKEIPNVIADV